MAINKPNCLDSIPPSLTPPMPRLVKKTRPEQSRRKRGGQAGNHNARKHGLYSSDLTADDMAEFSRDVMARGIDPDIALVRARLRSVLLHAPSNRRAQGDAAGMLAKMYSDKLELGKTNTRLLKQVFLAFIESYSLVADCKKPELALQNESSVP